MSSNEIAVRVEGLGKRYEIYDSPRGRLKQFLVPSIRKVFGIPKGNYFKEYWALRDISFEIRRGESFGVVGRNGSGKSTLLQLVTGILAPTTGNIYTRGRIAALLELGSGFNPDFTGRENVFLNGMLLGMSQDEIEMHFDAIAAFADIGEYLEQPVKTYSSGMYVRLAFAVQACLEPDILIVDEALSVGDEKFQRKCYSYIEALRQKGTAILLVTHSTPTVEKFCQQAILIDKGSVHGIGLSKQIIDQYHALLYSDEQAYLRFMNEAIKKEQSEDVELAVVSSPLFKPASFDMPQQSSDVKLRAIITGWKSLDAMGTDRNLFDSGETITIQIEIAVYDYIEEIQAGLLIRTMEGITAYGTSTHYYEKNFKTAKPGQQLVAQFTFCINLCQAPYFVSVAIAEPVSAEMSYLDKKTDVIVLHIKQNPLKSSGIAALPADVFFSTDEPVEIRT